jgi:hypothetical protein
VDVRSRVGDRPPSAGYTNYAVAPFQQRIIALERLADALPAAAAGGALLNDVDRFLTLARLAPGPVTLHCPGWGRTGRCWRLRCWCCVTGSTGAQHWCGCASRTRLFQQQVFVLSLIQASALPKHSLTLARLY